MRPRLVYVLLWNDGRQVKHTRLDAAGAAIATDKPDRLVVATRAGALSVEERYADGAKVLHCGHRGQADELLQRMRRQIFDLAAERWG